MSLQPQIAQETAMPRSRKLPHCRRRTLPNRLKAEIILRQDGRCTDCGTRLVIGHFVFDHRPPLALRDVCADANHPELLAAICMSCDKQKTQQDLRDIARVKRRGFTYNQFLALERLNVVRRGPPSSTDMTRLKSGEHPRTAHEVAVREAQERWEREERGLGSWPPFSRSDLT